MVPTLAAVITQAGDGSSHGKTFSLLQPAGLGARSEMLLRKFGRRRNSSLLFCFVFANSVGKVAQQRFQPFHPS